MGLMSLIIPFSLLFFSHFLKNFNKSQLFFLGEGRNTSLNANVTKGMNFIHQKLHRESPSIVLNPLLKFDV